MIDLVAAMQHAGAFDQAVRNDGWVNNVSGMGTTRDKSISTEFVSAAPLSFQVLSALYANNDLAAKIVDIYPREAFREGFEISGKKEDPINEYLEPYEVTANMVSAWVWARLYGGAAIWIGADGAPETPLGESYDVDFLKVIDRRWLIPTANINRFGVPQSYSVVPPWNTRETIGTIHVSRLVLFPGARTDDLTKRSLLDWDLSVLQRPHEALKSEGTIWKAAETLLHEASIGVFKIPGLYQMFGSGKIEEILSRFRIMDQVKGFLRSLVLDAGNGTNPGETYERIAAQFAGIPDLTDRSLKRVAAAAEIPVTVLMGEAPAGLNATGDSDLRWFFARVCAERLQIAEPRLRLLLKILSGARTAPKGDYSFKWPPLWTASALEQSQIYSNTATADSIYIDKQVILPEEVALSRFGADGYSQDTQIDRKAREEALLVEIDKIKDPSSNEPDPVATDPEQGVPPPPAGEPA